MVSPNQSSRYLPMKPVRPNASSNATRRPPAAAPVAASPVPAAVAGQGSWSGLASQASGAPSTRLTAVVIERPVVLQALARHRHRMPGRAVVVTVPPGTARDPLRRLRVVIDTQPGVGSRARTVRSAFRVEAVAKLVCAVLVREQVLLADRLLPRHGLDPVDPDGRRRDRCQVCLRTFGHLFAPRIGKFRAIESMLPIATPCRKCPKWMPRVSRNP